MHELSICRGLRGQLEQIAIQQGATAIERVVLQIGPLSGVEPQLLREAFPIAMAGSHSAGAELIIESLPLRVRCLRCEAESDARPNRLACTHCGHWQTQLLSGNELQLARVELTT